MNSVCNLIAQKLVKRNSNLTMGEAQVIAQAYIQKDMQLPAPFLGATPPPSGYFDSSIEWEILSETTPGSLKSICERLASSGYLKEDSTQKGLYTIADWLCPVCNSLLDDIQGIRG